MTTGIRKAARYSLRQCAKGNTCACDTAKHILVSQSLSIHAGANISFMEAVKKEEEHPNKLPFKGVLLIVDAPSTKPPHGSRGHRIYVPKSVAEAKLSTLIGMAINYDRGDLDSHETRHKVGVITEAWIKGNQVWVKGFAYKKDFPEVVRDLKQGGLGMSMELADVYVRDENEDVWHLVNFAFTGATILKKSAAAYYQTELVANAGKNVGTAVAAIAASGKLKGDKGMAEKKKETIAAASDTQGALLVAALKGAMSESFAPVIAELKASNERQAQLSNDVEELKGLYMIQAAAHEDDEEMEAAHEEDDEEASASKNDEEDEDDEEGDEDDLDASLENLEEVAVKEKPGEINKTRGDENKGDKTTVTDPPTQREKVPGNIAKGRLKSSGMRAWGKKPFPGMKSASIQAAAVEIQSLYAQLGKEKKSKKALKRQIEAAAEETARLNTKIEALEAQASQWAEMVNRKSVVPVEIRNLMAKGNMSAQDMMASGEKVPVATVDSLFAALENSGVQVDIVKRAELKNRMYQLGLMESGEVN